MINLKKYNLKKYNFLLIFSVVVLSVIGILVVGSAEPSSQIKQIIGVIVGVVVMVVISLIDYIWVLNFYWFLYAINLLLLTYVHFFGATYNNAKRWIDLGFTTLQPSDLTKIIVILFFAKYITEHERSMLNLRTIIKCILLVLPSLIFILTQPNLSNTICISALFCIILFIGGMNAKHIKRVIAVAVPSFAIILFVALLPNQPFLQTYQQNRILAWLNPEEYASDIGYQQQNSIMAIGSGQLTGKGLYNDESLSVKNGNFLLEAETDFIFAIIGEELGFLGCCAVIILILLIIVQCIVVGMRSQDLAGQIIAGGMASLIGLQSFINMGVATGLLPNTGLSLPFVSSGLTSIICFFAGIGFVLNVGLQQKKY